ncbi:hypothetical protein BDY17DRAFT_320783 [Neohortaea acidophila]|uniref:Uncharacterized protein n=1 Tax=Neohortaea acidophila TaxID=245834 RepID=A0A6A6Q3E6_9PEZI|nr:uncharacterized protein BDY17DRAFT_320783 [Neohortaea acidophila]KAF2485947.1 hypothetical protein BDY17DRAFT_320783 [Neohortaea acidophila]
MVDIHKVRRSNTEYFPNLPFVAVFVGGTQGIGRYAVEELAKLYSQPILRVYILGRNKTSADEVLASCRRLCPHGKFTFVQARNLALLEDVDATCAEIIRLERQEDHPRIDLLVQTQAQIHFGARRDTPEGLDQQLSLLYYSRIRFITQLMQLLEASTVPSGARVVSIDAAGAESILLRDDLSLRDPQHYSIMNAKSHAAYMTTMAFEHLASQHRRVGLVYMYPGLVFGPAHYDPQLPWWFKAGRMLLEPLLRWSFATPSADSGARTLFLASACFASAQNSSSGELAPGTDGSIGSGCYAVGRLNENLATDKYTRKYATLRDEELMDLVWKHTTDAFDTISGGNRFDS